MQKIRKHYGGLALGLLAIVPVFLWLLNKEFSDIVQSPGIFISSLGKVAALSGIVLYALMPVLSMRHRAISGAFGGIDAVYQLHKSAGKTSFVVILLHPLLLGAGLLIQGRGITTVWDWSSLLVITGVISLIGLILVTGISVYSHIRHQNWIWIHRLFGWMLPLFFGHALLAKSQIVQNKPLLVYMLTVGISGFLAFMYRSVFSKYLIKKYRYVVAEVNHMSESVAEVVLQPLGVPMSFAPGQFAYLGFDSPVINAESHPYSFSNANNGPYVRFTIKALGDDTATIQLLEPGTKAFIEGPYGRFTYSRVKNRKQVWIAGGIGITPFLSMARSFVGTNEYDIRFFYGTESLEDAVFLSEFIDITKTIPENFSLSIVSKEYSGFVSIDLIKESIDDLSEFDFMICGPPGMMQALISQLTQAGVDQSQIHFEAFSM